MHGVITTSAHIRKRIGALFSVYASVMQKPFEIETIARQELRRDRLFPLLTPEQCDFYLRAALEIGVRQAARHKGEAILPLAARLGATVEEYDGGSVEAGSVIYAEYDAAFRRIRLHRAGIDHLAARIGRGLSEGSARAIALDLLLAHELFHHLEATCLGPVHRTLPPIAVPVLRGLLRVHRHVLRTREIAAHSFAHSLIGSTDRLDRG